MKRVKGIFLCAALVGTITLSGAMHGCGTSLDPSTPLSAVTIGGTTLGDLLNQITVGDVMKAFEEFMDRIEQYQNRPNPLSSLTQDQINQIAALAADYDAGKMTREEFADQTAKIMGDAAPDLGHGHHFFGSPFGFLFDDGDNAGLLSLTDDQRTAVKDVFKRSHDDIDALRKAAQDAERAVLTDEQRAKLDQILQDRFSFFGMPFGHGPMGGPGNARPGRQSHFDRLAEELGLTDEQKTQINDIRDKLRTDVRARHEQAHTEFLNVLTAEQRAVLEALKAQRQEAHDEDDDGASKS